MDVFPHSVTSISARNAFSFFLFNFFSFHPFNNCPPSLAYDEVGTLQLCPFANYLSTDQHGSVVESQHHFIITDHKHNLF